MAKVKILKKFSYLDKESGEGVLVQCFERDEAGQFKLDKHMQRINVVTDLKGDALKYAKKIKAVKVL